MKTIASIGLFSILILLAGSEVNSQTKSSAAQTVAFAVNNSIKPALSALTNSINQRTHLNYHEITALDKVLTQTSIKVTISQTSIFKTTGLDTPDIQIDVRTSLQKSNSIVIDKADVLTVTD